MTIWEWTWKAQTLLQKSPDERSKRLNTMQFIADMHTHTIASSHAYSTVTENAAEAERKGIKIMAMTDHCVKMPDSPHEWHFYNQKTLPRKIGDVFLVRGVEANFIDHNGNLDIPADMYPALDWIIACYHHPACMPGTMTQHTESYIKAIENLRVNCLGHTDSPDFAYDIREVCVACREYGKAMELNVARIRDPDNPLHSEAYKFYRHLLSVCAEEGTNIVVDSDSHFWNTIGAFDRAAELIEEVKFPQELVLSLDERRMKDFITRHRQRNIFE